MPAHIAFFALVAALLGPAPALLAEEIQLDYQGLTLNANLEQVDASWPQGPVLLMTHGTLAHNGMEIMSTLQELFAERGLSSLAITLSLGLSDRRGMYDCAVPHRHLHADAQGEIRAWLDWLEAQGAKRVVLLGHSRSGSQSARFAIDNDDPALIALVLIAPQTRPEGASVAEYRKSFGKDLAPVLAQAQAKIDAGEPDALLGPVDFLYCPQTQVTAETFVSYYNDDANQDTPRLLPQTRRPVLVIGGTQDTTNPTMIERVEPLADGERVRLVVIEGADHFFRDLYAEELADAVKEFLAQ